MPEYHISEEAIRAMIEASLKLIQDTQKGKEPRFV